MPQKKLTISPGTYLNVSTYELLLTEGITTKTIKLEPISARLLYEIAQSQDVVSREKLIEEVWEGNTGVGNAALRKHIYKIRKLFEANGLPNPIETVPKLGYRLIRLEEPNKWSIRKKHVYMAVALAISGLVFLKLWFPGIAHMIFHGGAHRLMH